MRQFYIKIGVVITLIALIVLLLNFLIIATYNKPENVKKEPEYSVIRQKAISKELYKKQVMIYCLENKIYIDLDKIDSMYIKIDPEVQKLLDTY